MKLSAFSGFVVAAAVVALVGARISTDIESMAYGVTDELMARTGDHGSTTLSVKVSNGAPFADRVGLAVQLQSESLTAAIHEGHCNTLPTEPVFELNELEPAADEATDLETTVLVSDNPRIDVELRDIADGEHSIGIYGGAGNSEPLVACGEIGEQDEDRNVVMGLRSLQAASFAGVALLFDNADEERTTHVTLYIDAGIEQNLTESDGDDPATPTAIATPANTSTAGETGTPVILGTPAPQGTPVQHATPVVGEETPVAVQEEIYESPNYAYTVTYDGADWFVVEAETVEDELGEPVDILHISNGLTNAQFFGRTGTLDAEDCLVGLREQMEEAEGVTRFESRSGDDGAPLEGGDEDDAYALFDYTEERNGEVTDLTVFVRCQVIAEGESLLLSFLTAPTAEFEWEERAHLELLAGVELP